MKKILFVSLCLSHIAFGDSLGSLLFHGNCTTCHYEKKEVSAPAMAEVRARYKTAFADKKSFIKYLSEWVASPSKEHSIMLDAIKKHGLMPQLAYEKDVLEDIAEYIYETDFNNYDASTHAH